MFEKTNPKDFLEAFPKIYVAVKAWETSKFEKKVHFMHK